MATIPDRVGARKNPIDVPGARLIGDMGYTCGAGGQDQRNDFSTYVAVDAPLP